MATRSRYLPPLIVSACLLSGGTAFSQLARPVLITQPVSNTNLFTLAGNTRPEANPANDAGPVSDTFQLPHMLLQLKRSPIQQQALDTLVEQQSDKTSSNYQKWLTPEQFGQYGLSTTDISTITGWLQSLGFQVSPVYPNNLLIDFSGTAEQIQQAFHTQIHNLKVNGGTYYANMSDPQIPAALAPAIAGIVSMNNFPAKQNYERGANYTTVLGGFTYYLVVPQDLQTIYNFRPVYAAGFSGQGETVAVVESGNLYSTGDWSRFRSTFGLSTTYPAGNLVITHPTVSGSSNCFNPGVNGASFEVAVDAEYASAAAPSATIDVASCGDTATFGFFIAFENVVNSSPHPGIISMSYGVPEVYTGTAQNAAINAAYEQAASEGISVFVSAGDSGPAITDRFFGTGVNATHGISISSFAATPYNVAVGGTDFGDGYNNDYSTYWSPINSPTFGSALSYINEIPWDDSCANSLLASYFGAGPYSFCNTTTGLEFINLVAGSGGPSGCFTGTPSPSTPEVVSGTCQGVPKPFWQAGFAGTVNDGVRDIPDVSLFASNGFWGHFYPVCFSDAALGGTPCSGAPSTWPGAGGTSFSAPIMAGVQALVNQKTGKFTGNPNPIYYQLAKTEYGASGSTACNSSLGNGVASTCTFYDVTQGTIDVNCSGSNNCYDPSGRYGVLSTSDSSYQPAYAAVTGWDFATGIGSVNVSNLVNAYAAATR